MQLADDAGEDSFSFWPILKGENYASPLREATIHHSINGRFALRMGDWVWINAKGSGGWTLPEKEASETIEGQLYQIKEDPTELYNRIDEYPDKIAEMTVLLNQYINSGRSR